jgi:hypothetical protein
MSKLTFDEALERIGERPVAYADVQAKALQRIVWVAEWHLPGCLSETFVVLTTKRDAIASALNMAESEDGPPRGMKTALQRYGRFDSQSPMFGTCINTVEKRTLGDLL